MSVNVADILANAYLIIFGIIVIICLCLCVRWTWLDFTRKCPVCEHRRGWHFGGPPSDLKFYCSHSAPALYASTQNDSGVKYYHMIQAREVCKCTMSKDDIDLNF
jgi:hypothetical protein